MNEDKEEEVDKAARISSRILALLVEITKWKLRERPSAALLVVPALYSMLKL